MTYRGVISELASYSNRADAQFLQRFFKTGPGQYGEGDVFIGARMGPIRAVAKKYKGLSLAEIQKLLDTKVHEHRMCGLVMLTLKYPKANVSERQNIYDFYLKNLYKGRINNWDLIDVTCPRVVGQHLLDKPKDILYDLARTEDLWQKRVAIISTATFINNGDSAVTLDLSKILLSDPHDLIQKAVGWMLREVGKRCDRQILLNFLDDHAHEMPRTMLRYSIEHLPTAQRKHYMALKGQTQKSYK